MKRTQLYYLFVCNFGIYFIGTGLLPILPLYGTGFGVSPGAIGLYLGNTYVAITAGTMLTGWLAKRFSHRRLLIGTGLLGIPAVALLGQATMFWQVVVLTALVWFLGGIGLTLSSILTGLYSADQKQGRSFGLLYLAYPASMLLSGLLVGFLVEWHGYGLMFAMISLAWALYPIAAYLRPGDAVSDRPARPAGKQGISAPLSSRPFYGLLLVTFLLQSVAYGSRMGITMSMTTLSFSAGAISSTSVVIGLFSILFGLAVSAWSDRVGRKLFLMVGTVGAVCGALLLIGGTRLWQFWLATGLLSAGQIATGAVIPALVAGLLEPDALNQGVTRLSSINRMAGIVGFVATGYVIEAFGLVALYAIAAGFALAATIITALVPEKRQNAGPAFGKLVAQLAKSVRPRQRPVLPRRV